MFLLQGVFSASGGLEGKSRSLLASRVRFTAVPSTKFSVDCLNMD